ncbi:MAG: acyltransferase family protein [Lachnospiraceae bacterium]|nr:acyltransferase family protein [Lachnospiraceae bacterium]
MTIFLIFLLALCLAGMTVSAKGSLCSDYISRENTMSVRGLFLFFIITRHFKEYVTLSHPLDAPFLLLDQFLGQGIVSIFLFYSGYGIMEAVKKKGAAYVRSMPVKRLLLTLLHFILAVLLYLAVGAAFGKTYSLKQILLAFIGWISVGNSNWYIFSVLCLYLASWLSFSLFRKRHTAAVISTLGLTVLYILILYRLRPTQGWWYNTALCYPGGMWFSMRKDRLMEFFRQRSGRYTVCTLFCIAAVIALRPFTRRLFLYELWAVLFAAAVVLLTMKFSLHNPVLRWMGEHTFWIYILQRLPMMLLHHAGISRYPYLFLILSIAGLLPLAAAFEQITRYADRKILNLLPATRL